MDNSLSASAVLHTLTEACSQRSETLKPAEQRLKEWETRPGFYSSLMMVFADRSVDTNVRWLSILYFKNGVDRYWRKNAPNAIAEQEKAQLRGQLLSCIVQSYEPVNQLATQLAVLVGKVARVDCPNQWPELIPALLSAVRSSQEEQQHQQRILAAFYQVVKCMASRRLAHDRKVFEEVAQGIFSYVFNIWAYQLQSLEVHLADSNLSAALVSIEYSVLTLKVLRKLVIFGYKHPGQLEEPSRFLHTLAVRFEQVCDSAALVGAGGPLPERREKVLMLMSKVLLDMLEFHPTSFVQLLQPSLTLAYKYCFTEGGYALIFEALAVNLLNVVREIVVSEEYKPPKAAANGATAAVTAVNPASYVASQIQLQFFSEAVVLEMGRRLVCDYFPLASADLSLWDSDPEHYVIEEGGDSLKFSLRPCAEALYLVLLKKHHSCLAPQLIQMLAECCRSSAASADAQLAGDLRIQLRREAVYNAVGLSCFDLYEEVDFNALFVSALLSELRVQHPVYRLVRRRVVWLIGRLHGIRLSAGLQPTLLDAVEAALARGEDLVVRLEAAATLRLMLDDFDFDVDRFAPRLSTLLDLLCALLADVVSGDTRLNVLHAVSFVVERVGTHVRPHAGTVLTGCLVPLWHLAASEGDEQGMLRCAVAGALCHLVRGLGESSPCAYPLVLPVVRLAVDLDGSAYVYLLDDGLELWEATLQCAPSTSTRDGRDGLLSLCAAVPRLVLELASESLRACARIVEAYLALDGLAVVRSHGRSLAQCLTEAACPRGEGGCDLKPEGLLVVLKVVELFFTWFPADACELFAELSLRVVGALLRGDEGEKRGGDEPESHPAVLGAYVALLSRAALHDPGAVMAYASEYARRNDLHRDGQLVADRVLDRLILRWIDCLDCTSQPEKRKLSALGLTSLLRVQSAAISGRLPDIIGACVQVLCDVCQVSWDSSGGRRVCIDTLVQQEDTSSLGTIPDRNAGDDNEHDRRRRALLRTDPVFNMALADHVVQTFGVMEQWHRSSGVTVAARLQAAVDPVVLQQLGSFLSVPAAVPAASHR